MATPPLLWDQTYSRSLLQAGLKTLKVAFSRDPVMFFQAGKGES